MADSELDNVLAIMLQDRQQSSRLYHKRAVDTTGVQIGYITNVSAANRILCRYSVKIAARILHNIPLATSSAYYSGTGHRPYPLLTGQAVYISMLNNTRTPVILGCCPWLSGDDLEGMAAKLAKGDETNLDKLMYPPVMGTLYKELGNFAEIDVKPMYLPD